MRARAALKALTGSAKPGTMLPSALGTALAYHFRGDTGITSSVLCRIPGAPGGVNGTPVCVSNSTLQVTNNSFSFAGWFVVDTLGASRDLVTKWASGQEEFVAYVSATGQLVFLTAFVASPNFHAATTANTITAGVPFFASWGCNGTQQWARLNNGTRANTAHNTTTHAQVATASPFRIGVDSVNSSPLTGAAGNLGYWRGRNLTDTELNTLYNSGAGRDYSELAGLSLTTSLISYWRMKERTGTRSDSHGTNHLAGTNRCQVIDAGTIVPVTPSDGDGVSQWNDQSSNARHLTALAPSKHDYRLVYNATGLNGLGTVRAYATQTARRAFTLPQPTHHFMVVKPHAWGSGAFLLDGNTENAMALKGIASAPNYGLNAGATGPAAEIPIKRWSIVELCFNGADSFIRVNGGTKHVGNAGTAAAAGLFLGVDGGSDVVSEYAKHGDVEFAEIICASAVQTEANAAKLRRYLTNKWGLGENARNAPAWNPANLFVVDGHSLAVGYASGQGTAWRHYLQATLGSTWDHLLNGYNGKNTTEARADYTRASWAYDASRTKNVWCAIVPIDLLADGSGNTAQQAWDAYKLHLDELRVVGWEVIAATTPPYPSAGAGAGYEARRASFRTIALADTTAYDALVDIAGNANLGTAVGGEPPTDSLYHDSDGVHHSYRGSIEMASLYATAIASL